ncbi:hypothetical protein JCM11251_007027 [Rhodosporidiobolus azoricus]
MRTSIVLLSFTAVSLAAGKPAEGGSIEALLERISQRNNQSTAASARVSAVPDHPKNETVIPPTPPPAAVEQPVPKKEKDGPEPPKEGHNHESKRAVHAKMAKRVRAKADEENAKRWVWATGIIQDDTPASAVPDVGQNANLLSSGNTIPVNTPAATLVAPSFPPIATTTPPLASTTTTTKPKQRQSWKTHSARGGVPVEHEEEKRWVWTNAIIQDDTPASAAPPIGQNVNGFNPNTPAASTPTGKPVAPSFPPIAAPSAVTPSSAKKRPTYYKAPQARGLDGVEEGEEDEDVHDEEKRWVWSNQIIQDDTAAESAPPIGENANMLSGSAQPLTTPAATLVAPSFPPLSSQTPLPSSSSSDDARAAIYTTSTDQVAPNAVVSSASPTVVSAAPASQTDAAAAAQTTSPARHWWNPKIFFEELEQGFLRLFQTHRATSTATTSAAPGPVATETGNQKRYVWSNQIIQDDTEGAPPIGENVNLLTDAYAANTPKAAMQAPSFPPIASPSTTAAAVNPKALAADAKSPSTSSAESPVFYAAPVQQTTNARQSWKAAHEAAIAAAAAKKAKAAEHTTTTTTQVAPKVASTKTAAQVWYKAEPKERRMVKRERK